MFKLLDSFGFSASLLCAIHCAITPLLLTLGIIGYTHILINPIVEHFFIIISLLIALISIIPSYFRHHHKLGPLLILCIGLLFVLGGRILSEVSDLAEVLLTVLGASMIAMGHLLNLYFLRKHKIS